jgi:beta-lactam-binding protein with PASTA domain
LLKRSLILNLLLALLIVIGLLYLFFNSLNTITNHGKETKVPSLEHKSIKVAMAELHVAGFDVKVDSTYLPYKDPLEVLFQEPEAGMTVKYGRTIFLIVNKKIPPTFAMPNLNHMSFRNALLTLQSYRLIMGDTIYRPDLEAGAVLEQRWKGKIITPGALVPFGAKIDLVVGDGLTEEINVPNLIGKTWAEAKTLMAASLLMPNAVFDGVVSDSNNAIIYQQFPESINELDIQNRIKMGDMMDLRIKQNPSASELILNQGGSRQYATSDDSALANTEVVQVVEDAVTPRDTTPRRRLTTRGTNALPASQMPVQRKPRDANKVAETITRQMPPKRVRTEEDVLNNNKPKLVKKPVAKPPKSTTPDIKKSSTTETEYN